LPNAHIKVPPHSDRFISADQISDTSEYQLENVGYADRYWRTSSHEMI